MLFIYENSPRGRINLFAQIISLIIYFTYVFDFGIEYLKDTDYHWSIYLILFFISLAVVLLPITWIADFLYDHWEERNS